MLGKYSGNSKRVSCEERIVLYDWIRLIATTFVVLGHSTYLTITTELGG